jgi:hypothetical protein
MEHLAPILAVYGYCIPLKKYHEFTKKYREQDIMFDSDSILMDYLNIQNNKSIIYNNPSTNYPYYYCNESYYTDRYTTQYDNIIHNYYNINAIGHNQNKYIIFGLCYDDIDKNLQNIDKFKTLITKIKKEPIKIKNITEHFFKYDTPKKKQNFRKQELLQVPKKIKNFIDNLQFKHEKLSEFKISSFLINNYVRDNHWIDEYNDNYELN